MNKSLGFSTSKLFLSEEIAGKAAISSIVHTKLNKKMVGQSVLLKHQSRLTGLNAKEEQKAELAPKLLRLGKGAAAAVVTPDQYQCDIR